MGDSLVSDSVIAELVGDAMGPIDVLLDELVQVSITLGVTQPRSSERTGYPWD